MGGNASAAQAAVRHHQGGASSTGPESLRGAFQGRQVAASPAQGSTVRDGKQALANAGATGLRIRPVPAATPGSVSGSLTPTTSRELSAAVRAVSSIEADVWRAHALVKQSRKRMLTGAEWSELSGLISSALWNISEFRDRWDDKFGPSAVSGDFSPSGAEKLRVLWNRFD